MADLYRRQARGLIKQLARSVANLHLYPQIGTHVGGGVHVQMPAEFTYDAPNPGWTSLPYSITRRIHPTNDDWGVLLDDATQALNTEFGDERLTPGQQGQMAGALAAAIPIDATWNAAPIEMGNPLEDP